MNGVNYVDSSCHDDLVDCGFLDDYFNTYNGEEDGVFDVHASLRVCNIRDDWELYQPLRVLSTFDEYEDYGTSACIDCSCICTCCLKSEIYIPEQLGTEYVKQCKSKFRSRLLEHRTTELPCKSYFTADKDIYDREDGLCWNLLKANKCKNRYCVCICKCCLQEPFKMTLPERVVFEHWLVLARNVEICDMIDKTNYAGKVNPILHEGYPESFKVSCAHLT